MGFPRQEYWSRLPFPPPGDLPDPGIKADPVAPALAGGLFTTDHLGSATRQHRNPQSCPQPLAPCPLCPSIHASKGRGTQLGQGGKRPVWSPFPYLQGCSLPAPTESALFKVTLQVSPMLGKASSGREADGPLIWEARKEQLQRGGERNGEATTPSGTWTVGRFQE